MKLCMIGTGYVGLVSGVCFSDVGNVVYCVDKDNKKQGTIHADHSKRPATISYRCFEDLKVYTYGVSAIDNDDAWESYFDMFNAFGK